jgi:hypothetical protein
LNTGISLAIFNWSGNTPLLKERLIRCSKGFDIYLKELLIIFMGILSKPGALPDLNVIQVCSRSARVAGFNQIVSVILVPKHVRKDVLIEGIYLPD